MCGLCGVFGSEAHWTDASGNEAAFGDGAGRPTRRQERLYRAALANKVLGQYGLTLRDWDGNCFLLSNRTGQSQMVDHIAAVWPAAERMARRPCDPLDLALIAALEREGWP